MTARPAGVLLLIAALVLVVPQLITAEPYQLLIAVGLVAGVTGGVLICDDEAEA